MFSKIRFLVDTDIILVANIANKFAHNSWTAAVFKDCLKAGYKAWVIEDNQTHEVLGFLIVYVHDHECQIMNIGIDPSVQRCGYAYQLLSHLLKVLKSMQVFQITLEVRESNMAAIRLYEKMNFIQIGIRKNYYPLQSGRENALIYALTL